jgi:hypothetical protein
MTYQKSMIVETPLPLRVHFLGLSKKGPFPTGHRAVITEAESGKSVKPKSIKFDIDYHVLILNRKKEEVDQFNVTYNHSKLLLLK